MSNDLKLLVVFAGFFFSITIYHLLDRRMKEGGGRQASNSNSPWFKSVGAAVWLLTPAIITFSLYTDLFHLVIVDFGQLNEVLESLGAGLIAISMGFFIMALGSLGDSYSPCISATIPKNVVYNGVYRYVRHPIYSSNILLFLGNLVISRNLIILAFIIILIVCYKTISEREDRELLKVFPSHRAYYETTGRFLPRFKSFLIKTRPM